MPQGEVRGGVQHGEGGKFQDVYSDDEVLEALIGAYPEPLTNKEVASRLGCSKATAHNRLHELNDEGQVSTKEVGARARVWWVDLTRPAREVNVWTGLEAIERDGLMDYAAMFDPPFNPTRTGTEELREFLRGQPFADLIRVLPGRGEIEGAEVLEGGSDGA